MLELEIVPERSLGTDLWEFVLGKEYIYLPSNLKKIKFFLYTLNLLLLIIKNYRQFLLQIT